MLCGCGQWTLLKQWLACRHLPCCAGVDSEHCWSSGLLAGTCRVVRVWTANIAEAVACLQALAVLCGCGQRTLLKQWLACRHLPCCAGVDSEHCWSSGLLAGTCRVVRVWTANIAEAVACLQALAVLCGCGQRTLLKQWLACRHLPCCAGVDSEHCWSSGLLAGTCRVVRVWTANIAEAVACLQALAVLCGCGQRTLLKQWLACRHLPCCAGVDSEHCWSSGLLAGTCRVVWLWTKMLAKWPLAGTCCVVGMDSYSRHGTSIKLHRWRSLTSGLKSELLQSRW